MEARPIDANALRKRIEEWMHDYIDTAPTIEAKDNG